MTTYGNGILRTSARPIELHVAKDGEVWFCDAGVDPGSDFGARGCSRASDNPQNE